MFRRIPSIIRSATRRRYRIRAYFVVACWLFLNAQLAIASHASDTRVAHAINTTALTSQSSSMDHMLVMKPSAEKVICDKYCNPDNGQTPSSSLQLNALPLESTGQLLALGNDTCINSVEWLAPPVTGPPAEIRFCRFRE